MGKRLSTTKETWVRSLGWEDPLEKEMAIHSRTIAWKIPWVKARHKESSSGILNVFLNYKKSMNMMF